MQIDPFENTITPAPRDTIPNDAGKVHSQLEVEILKMKSDFIDLNNKLRLVQECLDGISSSAATLAALYRKDTP